VRALSIVPVVIALLLIGASAPAFADVIPPPGDCEKKTEGDACKDYDGKAGACGTITYTRTFIPSGCNVSTTEPRTESGGEGIALIFGALILGLGLRAR
jgi:hypothetical protein